MSNQADIVAYDSKGNLVLVVEVKNRRKTGIEWAKQIRRNILARSEPTHVRYFLLALPDRFYLWVDKQQIELVEPDYVVNPLPFLRPYLGMESVPEYLTPIGFEMVVEAWLATLTWGDELPDDVRESGDWLIQSGLFDAIKHGRVASKITS